MTTLTPTLVCAGCGSPPPPGASFCPRCGKRLPAPCTQCGYACDPDFAFCPRCGTPRGVPAAAPAATLAPEMAPAAASAAATLAPETTPAAASAAAPDATPVVPRGAAAAATTAAAPTAPQATAHADAPDADRRQVTVVFADLSGFTALAESIDPETLRTFQNALFEAMAAAIARYDGFVEKFVGDAVLAVFGAPRAHEDDPARALDASLDMMARVHALSAEWVARLGREVTLHVGVHTGPVVAGSLGAAATGAYAVTGDTVNTAARLLSTAEPGTIVVSQATEMLARHRFEFAPPTEVALHGRQQAMRVHRLVGVRSDAEQARGLAALGLAAPLIGRTQATDRLRSAFERMHGGRAQLVTIVGEAGAGKSRLVDEFLAQLEREHALGTTAVRRARCSSLGEATYGTFAALFRDAYRVDDDDALDVARDKLDAGLRALGASPDEALAVAQVLSYLLGIRDGAPQDIEPEQLSRQIRFAGRALLAWRLAHQPVMLVVDDLQWADTASLDLLREIVDELADRPLMVIALQRRDAGALRVALADATSIELAPLAVEETRSLVGALLDARVDGALAPMAELVVARAGGNPMFVEEIVRSLVERGLLVRTPEGWSCASECGAVDVPPTLYGLLLSRLDRLGVDDRRTVQEAAVLGVSFDRSLLQAIATEPRATSAALHRLSTAGILACDASGERWRFAHAMMHEVVYQNLLLARRTELHERAGRALEDALDIAGDGDARATHRLDELEALGHHWSHSHDRVRGAHYLLAAGDWARAVYANDDAMRHYERALHTLEADARDAPAASAEAQAVTLDARERRADLLALQGRRDDALAQYETVRHAAQARHERVRAARVLRKIGGLYWDAGERPRASACFEEGLAALGDEAHPIERAHLYQEMGRLAFRTGDHETALAWAQRALAELPLDVDTNGASAPGATSRTATPADAGGAHAVVRAMVRAHERDAEVAMVRAQACNTLGVALARLGREREAVEQIERSVRQAEANGMLQAACRGYTNLGVLYATLDPQRSIDTCLRGLETARKVGDLAFQSRLYANLAVAYCALTNRCEDEGIEAARTAASLDRRLGLLDHLAVPLIVLGQIYQCHGDHERARASYEEALGLAEQANEPQLLFPCYDGLATLHLDAGKLDDAERYLNLAQAACERAGVEPDALMVLPFLC